MYAVGNLSPQEAMNLQGVYLGLVNRGSSEKLMTPQEAMASKAFLHTAIASMALGGGSNNIGIREKAGATGPVLSGTTGNRTAYNTSQGKEVVEQVGVKGGVVGNLEPGNPLSTSLPRKGERLVINQGNLPICGPTSCAMALDTSGRLFDLPKLIIDSRVTSQGAYMGDMAAALRNQGLSNARIANNVSIDELTIAIHNGNPAIVATRLDRGGHAVVVDGITT